MSNAALKVAATGVKPAAAKNPVVELIERMKPQMALALPKHVTAERMARTVLTELRRVPALSNCNQQSLLGAVMTCSQLGLEPGNSLGHVYLIPFGREVTLVIGYRGMIDLARRSGQILSLTAHTVHKNDAFDYSYGLDEVLSHKPAEGERGEMTHVYAVARLKGGGAQFEVMSRADIERVRLQSKAGKSGPWVTHFDEMAKKTAIRRLFKYLPVSIEMQRAVGLDEQADAGVHQDHDTIDMEGIDTPNGAASETADRLAGHLKRMDDEADADRLAELAADPGPWTEAEKAQIDERYRVRVAALDA